MTRIVSIPSKSILAAFALIAFSAGGVSIADTELNLVMQSLWTCKIDLDDLSDFDASELELDSLLNPDTERTLGVTLASSSIQTMCNGGLTTLRFSSASGGFFVPVPDASSGDNDAAMLMYTVGGHWGDQALADIGSAVAMESAQTLFSGNAVNGVLSILITLDAGQRPNSGARELPFDGAYGDILSLTLSTQP